MKLIFYDKSHGLNFGDLLNEPIFHHFLPGCFDSEGDTDFLGIGSILGLSFAKSERRKLVFSSGFAYGEKPKIDESYEVVCVRGPLTADALGLDKKLAITDGAYLLNRMPREAVEKKYDCSIMLHWSNLEKYDWKSLCDRVGINFIDPRDDVDEILTQLKQSKLVLAEAMHAAISADALRVPWIPIICYGGINQFKWQDFTQSMSMPYEPNRIHSLYDGGEYVQSIFKKKSRGLINLKKQPTKVLFDAYSSYQEKSLTSKVEKKLEQLAKQEGILSRESVLEDRLDQLEAALQTVQQGQVSTV